MARLSVIIPAFNEARRIGDTLTAVQKYFSPYDAAVEIVVVDDGSTDGTSDMVSRAALPGVRLIRQPRNLGKGFAVRQGMLEASGEQRLFMDADLATPLTAFAAFLPRLQPNRILIASRSVAGARVVAPQSAWRQLGGRWGKAMIRWRLLPGILDSQCGFKLFPGPIAEELFRQQTLPGWGFDFEILALARQAGYEVEEIPVEWRAMPDSRVRAGDYWKTWQDLQTVRRRLRRLPPPDAA
jgi:dolichyl-phosphate beta-glucosyltransferase